ncbi:MAG: hypothetical protein PVH68_00005, partial [Armatimonadota bacterium]
KAIVLDASATPGKKGVRGVAQALGTEGHKESPYYLELFDFFRCVRDDDEVFCSGEVGFHSAVTCLAANDAMEQEKVIELKPEMYAV